jgi:hypothetical protein
LVICCKAPIPHSIVKSILNYQEQDSIESKVDRKPPFSMLIMTSYLVQINFFPNFYRILKPEHTNSLNFLHEIICSFYDEGLLSLLIMTKGCFHY